MFCNARKRGWYEDRPPGRSLVAQVQDMTYALEVSACAPGEWAHAISSGLARLRGVWQHGGRILHGDLESVTGHQRRRSAR